MLVLGTGGTDGEDDDDSWKGELSTLKMIALLQEHGWEFSYGRDPVLILIEIEEIENSQDIDNDE